jgi:flagellin
LSTGLRINSGKDDPAGLIAAAQLGNEIGSTNAAISNTKSAENMINTADGALSQITTLLNDIRSLITQTANNAVLSSDQIAANQTQIESSLQAINRISQTTTYQNKNLLDGSLGYDYTYTTPGNVTNLTIQQAIKSGMSTDDPMSVSVAITTAAAQATVDETAAFGSSKLKYDVVFQLVGSKGSVVFTLKKDTAVTDVEAEINAVQDATGVTSDATGNLSSVGYGSDAIVNVNIYSQGALGGLTTASATGDDIVATVNGTAAQGKGNTFSVNTAQLAMSATVADGDDTAFAFDITGGGALFQLGSNINTNNQASLGIQSVDTGSLGGVDGLLYELTSGGDADLATNITKAANIVDEALNQITSLRGRLGTFQKSTLETNINALSDTVTALTNAQSTIQDADFAAETANLTRAQILVQSGTAVLQVANKQPKDVLALLQNL